MTDFQTAETCPPKEIYFKIKDVALTFIESVEKYISDTQDQRPSIKPYLELVQRTRENLHETVDENGYVDRLGSKKTRVHFEPRTMTRTPGRLTLVFSTLLFILRNCYGARNSQQMPTTTQRDLYYSLVMLFKSQTRSNDILQDVVSLLRIDRYSLGFVASSRGAAAGRLILRLPGHRAIVDLSETTPAGWAIPGNMVYCAARATMDTSRARYLVIVEKDGIFARLVEDRFFDRIPCILVTAKGFPDMATRAFAHAIKSSGPHLQVVGLCDCNPFGLALLLSFRCGSIRTGLESHKYTMDLSWVGLHPTELDNGDLIPTAAHQPFTDRDRRMTHLLMRRKVVKENPFYMAQLRVMQRLCVKAELEALNHHGIHYISETYLADRIMNRLDA